VRVNPIGVQNGSDKYPENAAELISARAGKVIAMDASEEARKFGNLRVMNIILLGASVRQLGLEEIDWGRVIAENVKPQYVALNQQAFELGKSLS